MATQGGNATCTKAGITDMRLDMRTSKITFYIKFLKIYFIYHKMIKNT